MKEPFNELCLVQIAEVSQQITSEIKARTPEDEPWMSSLCGEIVRLALLPLNRQRQMTQARAGRSLPSIGWHSFRHTVSAWGKEAGLELEDVKTLLRHENIATTSNVYGDLSMRAKRRIQQRLVDFVKRQAESEAAQREAGWQQAPVTIQ